MHTELMDSLIMSSQTLINNICDSEVYSVTKHVLPYDFNLHGAKCEMSIRKLQVKQNY